MSQPSFDLDLDDGGLPTLTVRELAEAINGALRRTFFEGVWVRGEVQVEAGLAHGAAPHEEVGVLAMRPYCPR